MAIRIRREVGLTIVAAAAAGLVALRAGGDYRPPRVSPKHLEYQADPLPGVVIADPQQKPALPPRDPFVEPSESEPLPPRDLPPPKLGDLPLVLPPLVPGPEAGWYELLRVPGGVVEAFQFPDEAAPGEGAAPAAAPDAAPAEAAQPREGAPKEGARAGGAAPAPGAAAGAAMGAGEQDPETYLDRVVTKTQIFPARIHNQNRLELEARPNAITEDIVFDWMSNNGDRTIAPKQVAKAADVVRIHLANTLANEIGRRRMKFGSGPESVRDRVQLLEELLPKARTQVWVYRECEKLADECVALQSSEDTLRLKALVLRERGDLDGELQFYRGLPANMQGSAFQKEGIGRIKALLGLHADAETDLRAAVASAPTSPRPHLALAEHLLARGRAAEALDHVAEARRFHNQLGSENEKLRLAEVAVGVLLAVGRPAEAESALSHVPEGERFAAPRAYLAGAIAYCRADQRAGATARFQAALSASSSRAQLAMGVMQMLDKKWVEARASLQAVADQDPLLRHRALQALGCLYARIGNHAAAATRLEEALVANPRDPYGLYLLGRVRRLAGQHDGALDALRRALQQRDDLLEAMAELALAHYELAERDPAAAAENLSRASIFADRCIELDKRTAPTEPRYQELQGLIHLKATNWRNARGAFTEAGSAGSAFGEAGRALVDYAQGRIEEAKATLGEMVNRLTHGDPFRTYAEATLKLIAEHGRKEQIRDTFERDKIGDNWKVRRNGTLGPQIDNGQVKIAGKFQRAGEPVTASYTLDLSHRFLGAEVVLAKGDARALFCGLVLEANVGGAAGSTDFSVRFGFRDGKPALRVIDGPPRAGEAAAIAKAEWVVLTGITADPARPQRLKLSLVPRSEGNERALALVALWNDVPVLPPRDIDKISRNTRNELQIGLQVEAKPDAEVDVRFDDFRLERRMEQ